jgi:hypothetical protein
MSRPHGKRVRRWGGKPLPLPRLGPDEPAEDVQGGWSRHSDHEAIMRQAYDDQRHDAAAAVLEFLSGRHPSDLKTAADVAMFRQLTVHFDELVEARHADSASLTPSAIAGHGV